MIRETAGQMKPVSKRRCWNAIAAMEGALRIGRFEAVLLLGTVAVVALACAVHLDYLAMEIRKAIALYGRVLATALALVGAAGIVLSLKRTRWKGHDGGFWPAVAASVLCFGSMHFLDSGFRSLDLRIDQALTVSRDTVRIDGAISASLPEQLRGALKDVASARRLMLGNNRGGEVQAGMDSAVLLRSLGVDTVIVDGQCVSVCALMAAVFPKRLLAETGSAGYHDLYTPQLFEYHTAGARARVVQALAPSGISAETVAWLFSSKPVFFPTIEELLEHKLITGCWDSETEREIDCSMRKRRTAGV